MTPAREALREAAAAESARVYSRTLEQHRAEHAAMLAAAVLERRWVARHRVVDLGEWRSQPAIPSGA